MALKILLEKIFMLSNSGNKCLQTKGKSYKDEIRTDFHDEALPSEKTASTRYLIKLIDSIYKSDKRYHHQVL